MVSLPANEKSLISRYVSWDTDGDACNCFNKRLSVSSCILVEGGKRDGASYVYRCRHYRHHHSSISFSALTHPLRGKQEPAAADPTLARLVGADADPATAATRPAKPPPCAAANASGCAQRFVGRAGLALAREHWACSVGMYGQSGRGSPLANIIDGRSEEH